MIVRPLHRRGFLSRLIASVALPASSVRAASDPPRDQGIGGTGLQAAPAPDGDRGIGGTGVVGTIRRFGSVVVNGLRISYPPDVRVVVDDRPGALADLRIGQVITVAAFGPRNRLSTDEVRVQHEVVGPVQTIEGRQLQILGQSVVAGATLPSVAPGDWVAVSGLRRLDGVIDASLVERVSPGVARVAGPVVPRSDGVAIGGLVLSGVPAGSAGSRAVVEGRLNGADFVPTSVRPDALGQLLSRVQTISIEAYAARRSDGVRLGSGLSIEGAAGAARAPDGRTFIDARVGANGGLQLQRATPASSAFDRTGPQNAPPGRAGSGIAPGNRNSAPTPRGLPRQNMRGGGESLPLPSSRPAVTPGGAASPGAAPFGNPGKRDSTPGFGSPGRFEGPGSGGGFGGAPGTGGPGGGFMQGGPGAGRR